MDKGKPEWINSICPKTSQELLWTFAFMLYSKTDGLYGKQDQNMTSIYIYIERGVYSEPAPCLSVDCGRDVSTLHCKSHLLFIQPCGKWHHWIFVMSQAMFEKRRILNKLTFGFRWHPGFPYSSSPSWQQLNLYILDSWHLGLVNSYTLL